jgi:hypothetical protein
VAAQDAFACRETRRSISLYDLVDRNGNVVLGVEANGAGGWHGIPPFKGNRDLEWGADP